MKIGNGKSWKSFVKAANIVNHKDLNITVWKDKRYI